MLARPTALFFAAFAATTASGQLRIVEWNVSDYQSGRTAAFQTAIYAVNPDNGLSMTPDVIIGQEFLSASAVVNFRNLLNLAPNSPGDWRSAPFIDGPDTDNALFYRESAIEFLGVTIIATGGPPPNHPRNVARFDLQLAGYTAPSTIIACYSSHMKASAGSENEARRRLEAERVRANAEELPAEWNFLIAGDLNIRTSEEDAYVELVDLQENNAGRFFDPINTPGDWHNNGVYRFVHTQDPVGAGGMDDRFDQILVSASLLDGDATDYIGDPLRAYSSTTWNDPNHSHRMWGNDGTSFDQPLRVEGNTMVGAAIAQALKDIGLNQGHLPVFIDIRVPPEIASDEVIDFGTVTQGDIAIEVLSVENAGDVDVWGADGIEDLAYGMLASSDRIFIPGGIFFDPAGGGGHQQACVLDTSKPGVIDETITISSNAPDEPERVVQVIGIIVPDCLADIDGDGDVGFSDVLAVLSAWGQKGGREDLDANGVVGFGDLLIVLSEWGPCV